MTRLYVNVLCEKCGEVYGVSTGPYFGTKPGDAAIKEGLCLKCEFENSRNRKEINCGQAGTGG